MSAIDPERTLAVPEASMHPIFSFAPCAPMGRGVDRSEFSGKQARLARGQQ
jgi:hypothetical protein